MSKVERKKNESFDAFMRRTKRLWIRSGKQTEVRKRQVFAKKKTKNQLKESAVRREQIISKTEYLTKIGRIVEDPKRRR